MCSRSPGDAGDGRELVDAYRVDNKGGPAGWGGNLVGDERPEVRDVLALARRAQLFQHARIHAVRAAGDRAQHTATPYHGVQVRRPHAGPLEKAQDGVAPQRVLLGDMGIAPKLVVGMVDARTAPLHVTVVDGHLAGGGARIDDEDAVHRPPRQVSPASRRWHVGHRRVPRLPMMVRSMALPQRRQGCPSRPYTANAR